MADLDVEKPQEHWQQEELVEEINLENNGRKYCHCMKEECFQYIVGESKILDGVADKEKDEKKIQKGNFSSNQR
jgi:hypothetical protein